MRLLRVQASAVVPAPAATIYGLIADYHEGHPSILPPQYFENLVVEEGGVGAGTRISFTMNAYGSRTRSRARVTEPEPGRVLVETVVDTGIVSRFTVEPLAEDSTSVTIETEYPSRGLRGWLESFVVPAYLKKVYAAELELLSRRAAALDWRPAMTVRSSTTAEQRLKELGIELPAPPEPFGAYMESVQTGNLLFLSGMLPTEGRSAKIVGRVGAELDVEAGRKAARLAALNVLAVARKHLQSLDRVTRVVRLGVSVATAGDVRDQPKVADAASELLQDVFGKDKSPCRLVYGVASLPLGTPVELEVIFEVGT